MPLVCELKPQFTIISNSDLQTMINLPVISRITHFSVLSSFVVIHSSSSLIHLNSLQSKFPSIFLSYISQPLDNISALKLQTCNLHQPFLYVGSICKVHRSLNSNYEKRRNSSGFFVSMDILIDVSAWNITQCSSVWPSDMQEDFENRNPNLKFMKKNFIIAEPCRAVDKPMQSGQILLVALQFS